MSKTYSERSGDSTAASHSEDACAWHRAHCADTDLCCAVRIRDAYDFDDSKRKDVVKREQAGVRNFGTVKISRLYPLKIYCDVCRTFIVDRSGEEAFYFCWRCRRAQRALALCTTCFERGALSSGPRRRTSRTHSRHSTVARELPFDEDMGSNGSSPTAKASYSRNNSKHVTSALLNSTVGSGGGAADARASSRGSTRHPTTVSVSQPLSTVLPSGLWIGQFEELGSRRAAQRTITFRKDGSLVGYGDDNCSFTGSFASGLNSYHVKWVEIHEWGQLEVKADISVGAAEKEAQINGKFTACDGGKGSIHLRSPWIH